MKLADITPVYKKKSPLDKENYRPVSVLLVVSKGLQRIMTKKIMIPLLVSFLPIYVVIGKILIPIKPY